MKLSGKLAEILNSTVSINLDYRFNRKRAIFVLVILSVSFFTIGTWLIQKLFGSPPTTYYDYRIAELQELLRDRPDDKNSAMELALNLYLKGETDKAITLAADLYDRFPDNKDVMLKYGLMLSDSGDSTQAVALLGRLVEVAPGFEVGRVRFHLGKCLFESKNYEAAKANLEVAIQVNPGYPVAHYYLGKVYEELGNDQSALVAYNKALLLAGDYPEAENAAQGLRK